MGKRLDAFFEELASGKSDGAASAAPVYGPKTTAFLESLAENASAGQFPKNAFADTLPQGVAGPVRNDRIMPAYRQSQSREENYGPAGGNIDTSKDYLPLDSEWNTRDQYTVGVNDRKYTILDEGGKSIIIPMVDASRMSPQLTDREAVELYHKTGKNYGTFDSYDAARAYLDVLKAKDRARQYDAGTLTDRDAVYAEKDKRELERKEREMRKSYGYADSNFIKALQLAAQSGLGTTNAGLSNISELYRNNKNMQQSDKAISTVSAEERQQIGEKSAALGVGYDLVQNFAMNAPAMAAGGTTGLPIVGSAVIFASSFGNDLKYAEEGGHDPGRAYAYAFLDGLNQAALDYVGSIPGISKIGDTLTKNIKNPILKFLGNMGEEALTEDAQSVLENGLKNIILGEEADASPFSEEAMYSALLGALSAGILNGPQTVLEAGRTVSVGNSFIKNDKIGDAIRLGLSNVKSSEEYQTAAKMATEMTEGKTPSAYQLGALVIHSLSDTATTARNIDETVRESAQNTGVSDDVAETVAAVAVRFSKKVCFVPSDAAILQTDGSNGSGAAAVGAYDSASDTIFLNAGVSSESATEFVLKHELTHGIEKTSMWKSLRRVARQQMGDAAFDAEVSRIRSRRAAVGEALDAAGAEKEVVANFVGNNLFTENFAEAITRQDTKLSSVFAGTFYRLRYAMDAIRNGRQAARMRYAERLFTAALDKTPGTVQLGADGDTDAEGKVQYQLDENFGEQLRDWLEGNGKAHGSFNGKYFVLGTTPDILIKHGAKNVPVIMYPECVEKVAGGKGDFGHDIDLNELAKLPAELNNPVLLFRGSVPNSLVALTELKNKNGHDIIAAIHCSAYEGRTEITKIASVYSKTNARNENKILGYVDKQVQRGNLIDGNIEKASRWFTRQGLQLPELVQTTLEANTTVSQNTGDVNSQYMQNSENDARGSTQHAFAEDADGGIAVEEKVQPDADAYKTHRIAQDMERAEKHRDAVKEREERLANEKQTSEEASPVEEITQMVEERKAEKRTKFQKKQEAAREDLRRRWQNGALTDEAYDAELAKLTDEAVAENDRKWKSGNRGDAAMRQALGEEHKYTREKYIQKEVEQEKQERREKAAAAEEKKEKTALQNKVIRLMDEAKDRLAHPQKNRHIPLQHTQTIIDLLRAITVAEEDKQRYIAAAREKLGDAVYPATKTRFENQIKKAMDSGDAVSRQLDRLAMEYKELQKSDTMKCAYAPELDAVISGFAESIRGKTLSDMTVEELNAAADIVQSVMYAEDNARVIPAGIFGDAVAVDDIVPDMIAEIRQNTVKVPRAAKNFQLYFSDPIATFNMLGGWHKNSLWLKLGNSIVRESTYREMAVISKFNELFRDAAQNKDFQKGMEYSAKNMVDSIGLVDEAGNKVSISRGAMLALYAHLGCSSNLEEIMTAGLQVPDLKAYYKGDNNQAYVDGKKVGVSGSNAAQIASLRLDLQDAVTRTNELRERFYALREEMQTDMRADVDGAAETAAEIDGAELKGRKAAIRDAYYELQEAETTESKLQQQYDAALRGERQRWLSVRNAIEGKMTKSEKAYMAKVSEWFNEHQKGFINEPYLNLYGIPRATVKNYFPRHRMMDLVHHDVETIRMDRSLENLGMLKERVKDSPVPILLTDITYEMREALDATAQFYGYAETTKTLQKVLGYIAPKGSDSTQLAFDEVFGKSKVSTGVSMKEYFDNLLADMNSARQGSNSTVDKALNFIRNNTVRAAIAANFRVFGSQFSAVFQIPSVIGWESFQKGMARAVHTKAPVELMRKYSAFWASRSANNIAGMEEIADARSGNMPIDKLYRKVDETTGGWLLNLSGKADAIATGGVVWFGCEEAVKAAHPELKVGSEEYYKAVGKLQDQVIFETQPDEHIMNRSELQRQTGSLIKLITLFKAQPLKILNQLVTAYNEMRVYSKDLKEGKYGVTKENVKEKKEKFAHVAAYSVVMGTVAYVALRGLTNAILHNLNGYRDDDGELNAGSIANAMGLEAISQIADLVPFGGQVYEVVAARVLGEKYYGLDDNALEVVGNILNDIANGNFKNPATYNKLIGDLSSALGIPYKNISSTVKGILYHAEDIKNGEFLSFKAGSGVGMTQTYRQLYKAMVSGKTEKAQSLREYLLSSGKTAAEIESGIRAAIRSENTDAKKQAERAIEEAMTNMYFDSLTEKEQNRVESSLRSFYADKVFSKAGGDMTAANEKAEKAVEKGVSAADYFVARVLKNAQFADKNGDGKVNKAEYRTLVDDMECTERVKQILKNMK